MPSATASPPFEGVRLATLDDLSRIATVAAAGFFHSPTFQYQRLYHAEYPDDTLSSYSAQYKTSILDPATVVLVAEDIVKPTEGAYVYEALRGATSYSPASKPHDGHAVVVGVASMAIAGSRFVGQFQTESFLNATESQVAYKNLNRDQCPNACSVYSEATASAKARYLSGLMRLTTVVVHPAYWRRGHAAKLVSWCTQLADMEGVPVGISAVPTGAIIAAKAGFEHQELIWVKKTHAHGELAHRNGPRVGDVELWVAIRRPKSVSLGSAEKADSQQ